MTSASKFVAGMLVVAALAWPAAALTACGTPADAGASGMECPPACPMMTHTSREASAVETVALPAPCCAITSDKPVPRAVPSTTTTTTLAGAVQPKIVAVLVATSVPVRSAEQDRSVVDETSSPQAVLCTFLI
jgi:hypothetical protein